MTATASPTARLSAGDPALRDGPAANAPIEREAADNRRYLRGSVWGQLVWSGRIEVGGTAAAPAVRVGPIDVVTLCNGDGIATGTWRPYNYNLDGLATDVGAGAIEGGGSLAADSFYYLYAVNDGTTTLAFQLSLTPPTASGAASVLQQYKRGQAANYRYLGWLRTDGSGNPFPMVTHRGRSLYRRSAIASVLGLIASGGLRVASGIAPVGSITPLSLAARLPPHVRVALLHAAVDAVSAGTGGTNTLSLYSGADTTSPWVVLSATASTASGDVSTTCSAVEIETTTGQAFGHAATRDTDSIYWSIDLVGGQE